MRVFLGTNILIDALVAREDKGLKDTATRILYLSRLPQFQLFISVISVPTVSYVLKGVSPDEKRKILRAILSYVRVISSDAQQVEDALNGNFRDIEDAMQYECAVEHGCDIIVTRNTKDYKEASIPVMDPQEFLSQIL